MRSSQAQTWASALVGDGSSLGALGQKLNERRSLVDAEEEYEPVQAVDWSRGQPRKLPPFTNYLHLQVVVLTRTRLIPTDLAAILITCTRARKLDVSQCGLSHTPAGAVWAQLKCLELLFIHRNLFICWDDVEHVLEAPALKWLTVFENPIASQLEFRRLVVGRVHGILAVDYWAVTDDERLDFRPRDHIDWASKRPTAPLGAPRAQGPHTLALKQRRRDVEGAGIEHPTFQFRRGSVRKSLLKSVFQATAVASSRFCTGSVATVVPVAIDKTHLVAVPTLMVDQMERELAALFQKSKSCSAACAIQACWRTYQVRKDISTDAQKRIEVIIKAQRASRGYLWKHRMVTYLKDCLAESHELHLMLSAKEMLRIRAAKRIGQMVRHWVKRRKDWPMVRAAATVLVRSAKGFMARRALLLQLLDLKSFRRIHFPERCAWEFLVLLNVARRHCRLATLNRGYKFEVSNFLGVRIPEASDQPTRRSIVTKYLSSQAAFVLRPKRYGRYSHHLWDGPVHRVVDECAPPHINRAYARVRRRGVAVNNDCRKAFRWSCSHGPHPIDIHEESRVKRSSDAAVFKDFRDCYTLSLRFGEGMCGVVFECTRFCSHTTLAAKCVELSSCWWERIKANRVARWRMMAREADYWSKLEHPNVMKTIDIFLGEFFVYVVGERFAASAEAAIDVSRRAVRRTLSPHIAGELSMQMLSAVGFLHEHHLVHGDVHLNNFCVDAPNLRGKFRAVLVDLIHCRRVEPGTCLVEPIGDKHAYWAPEVFAKVFAHGADVWALGVALWKVFADDFPFTSAEATILEKLQKTERMVQDQFDLASTLLEKDASVRSTAAVALECGYLVQSHAKYDQELPGSRASHVMHHVASHAAAVAVAQEADVGEAADVAVEISSDPDGKKASEWRRVRREEKLRHVEERYVQGERLVFRIRDALQTIAGESEGVVVELETREWCTPELCVQNGVAHAMLTDEAAGDGGGDCGGVSGELQASSNWDAGVMGEVPRENDTVLLELAPSEEVFGVPAESEAAAQLRDEVAEHRAMWISRGPGCLVRVLDVLVLRVVSPKGRYLVQVGTRPKNSDAPLCASVQFPTLPFTSTGRGAQGLLADCRQLVEVSMGMPSANFSLLVDGGVAQADVVPSAVGALGALGAGASEASRASLGGVTDLCRRYFVDADVEANLSQPRYTAMGLTISGDEVPFHSSGRSDGMLVYWEWWTAERCREQGLPEDERHPMAPELAGLRGLNRRRLGLDSLPQLLKSHGVKLDLYGVEGTKTLRQLCAEVRSGATALFESMDARAKSGLQRCVEVIVVCVRRASGEVLVRARHVLEGDRFHTERSLPKATLKPFEDSVSATRRLLAELHVPLASARARLGPRRFQFIDDQRYPGVDTICIEQDVDVQLGPLKLSALRTDGVGARTWVEDPLVEHPIAEEDESVDLQLRDVLEGPEQSWPPEARKAGTLRKFMLEARRLGSRPSPPTRQPHGAVVPQGQSLKIYRNTVWLGERMLCYECEDLRCLQTLASLLIHFKGFEGEAPLVRPVPFLPEKPAREVAAVVCIQAAFRAYRARCSFSCGLRTALTIRRVALCIQNVWRWSLTWRRMALLEGALRAVKDVRTSTLYVEERLLVALNLINNVSRYAPIRERQLGFGYTAEHGVVLVRQDIPGKALRRRSANLHRSSALGRSGSSVGSSEDGKQDGTRRGPQHRDFGLPSWLWKAVDDMQAVSPDGPYELRSVCGLQGLFCEGLPSLLGEEHIVSTSMPWLEKAARCAAEDRTAKDFSPALVASEGKFRFVELRFSSVAVAQKRALLLFMCTYSARHRIAVPLLSKTMLESLVVCKNILKLWDIYGLTWPQGDRTAPYQIRQRFVRQMDVVQANGREPWKHVGTLQYGVAAAKQTSSASSPPTPSKAPPPASTSSAASAGRSSSRNSAQDMASEAVAGSGLMAARQSQLSRASVVKANGRLV